MTPELRAHEQVVTSRALARLLHSKNFDPYKSPALAVVKKSLCMCSASTAPREAIGWERHTVVRLETTHVQTRPLGHSPGRCHRISYVDIYIPPGGPLAQKVFVAALQQPLPQIGGFPAGDAEDNADGNFNTRMMTMPPRSMTVTVMWMLEMLSPTQTLLTM